MKIQNQERGKLNEEDRLELATLLLKAGYTVRLGDHKIPDKNKKISYVEFMGDGEHVK